MSGQDRRGDLAARAAAVAGSPNEQDNPDEPNDPDEPDEAAGARAPRTRPVRVTVELSPIEHRALRQWCAQVSADLDLPVVAGAEVFRALLSLLRSDPDLAERVRDELDRTGGSRRRS